MTVPRTRAAWSAADFGSKLRLRPGGRPRWAPSTDQCKGIDHEVRAAGDPRSEWATRHGERVERAKAKLAELGIKLESVYYTQGDVDFVDVVDAPNPEAMLAFSVWYVNQGYGRFRSLPAFDDAAMRVALKKT
jgi:uncharacterized protein with GYD domain